MKDKDVKFCDEQIDKKKQQLDQLNTNLQAMKVQFDDFQELERYYKEEKKGVMAKMQELNGAIHRVQCELGQMRRHRHDLKTQKKFLAYQNRIIEKGKKC